MSQPTFPHRVKGLDAIRFICAAIVCIFHAGFIPEAWFGDYPRGLAKIALGINNCLFNGPAAVIVFFVISGFCIHFPFRQGATPLVTAFYSRRLIRILLPAAFGAGVWLLAGKKVSAVNDGIFWSVTCEVVYYLLYPLLLVLGRRLGWGWMIGISFLAAFALSAFSLETIRVMDGGYPAFGIWNWVVGLPCWLLGCLLAEQMHRFRPPSTTLIWFVRLAMFGGAGVLQVIRFHAHVVWLTNPFTLNLYALFAFIWLGMEIAYYQHREPWKWLEKAGQWSYSLYLIHYPAPAFVLMAMAWAGTTNRDLAHFLGLGAAFALSYVFYRLVEAPSHQLAVMVSRRFTAKAPALSRAGIS